MTEAVTITKEENLEFAHAVREEDLKFLKSLHAVLKSKREEVEAQYERSECDHLWRDGAVDVLDFVEARLDRLTPMTKSRRTAR